MIDPESWELFIVSFFTPVGVDKEWLAHIVLNWNALKNESACGCYLDEGNLLKHCTGYEEILEIRRANAEAEPLGENSEIY